jgi:hypothetical protein
VGGHAGSIEMKLKINFIYSETAWNVKAARMTSQISRRSDRDQNANHVWSFEWHSPQNAAPETLTPKP